MQKYVEEKVLKLNFGWLYYLLADPPGVARAKEKKKKRTVDNEIIDSTTTNVNFLKILFPAFTQKNGEQKAAPPTKIRKIAA